MLKKPNLAIKINVEKLKQCQHSAIPTKSEMKKDDITKLMTTGRLSHNIFLLFFGSSWRN